jgi:hypothetical protein
MQNVQRHPLSLDASVHAKLGSLSEVNAKNRVNAQVVIVHLALAKLLRQMVQLVRSMLLAKVLTAIPKEESAARWNGAQRRVHLR